MKFFESFISLYQMSNFICNDENGFKMANTFKEEVRRDKSLVIQISSARTGVISEIRVEVKIVPFERSTCIKQ